VEESRDEIESSNSYIVQGTCRN